MQNDAAKLKYKTKIVDNTEVLYGSWWINDLEHELHFNWYYHQANVIYKNCSRDMHLLEIGVGTNLLSDLLRRRKWTVSTIDIDADKNPDICESAFDFDYNSSDYRIVLAFEIFEHIPYNTFLKTINKISKSHVKKIIFSLPWNELSIFKIDIKLPKVKKISINPTIPRGRISTPAHFWELFRSDKVVDGKKLVSLRQLIFAFQECGFELRELQKIGNIQYFQALR